METVYKYCGAFGADILRHCELKVTPPNQFNDQLEFTPKMICSDPVRWAKRTLTREHVHRTMCEALSSKLKFVGSFAEFQQKMKQPPTDWIEFLAQHAQDKDTLADDEMRLLNYVSDRWGILCLSEGRHSVLMWGHYCDKPHALVIGFDKSADVFQQANKMRPVNYVRKRIVFDTSWDHPSPELGDFEDQIIFSKSEEWKYEQELRQAFMLSSFPPRPLMNGGLGYFLRIKPEVIVSVTLGPRCSPEQEAYVRLILQQPWFSHVKLDRARVDEDSFSLRFEPIA